MIAVTPTVSIDDNEIELSFVRASGPGGQNVNKVSSAVQLRFDALGSPNLPEDLKDRLIGLAGARMTKLGVIVLTADRHRSQERNRADVVERLVAMLAAAAHRPEPRRPTRTPRVERERRMDAKSRRAALKTRRSGRIDLD